MKESPILFSAPMVRALLAGTKTQTRRIFKPDRMTWDANGRYTTYAMRGGELSTTGSGPFKPSSWLHYCPYGQPGDRLWVRETFARIDGQTRPWIETDYQATYTHGDRLGDTLGIKKRWTPSIHMPRAASRITLEITSVRVERLQDISEAEALAEGIQRYAGPLRWVRYLDAITGDAVHSTARDAFFALWIALNGQPSFNANPLVWVLQFKHLLEPRP